MFDSLRKYTHNAIVLLRDNILVILLMLFLCSCGEYDISIDLHIKDHKFDKEEIHLPTGKKIRLVVYNDDDSIEEFESTDLHREKIVQPHSKITVNIGKLQIGEYIFFGEFHEKTAKGKIVVE